MSGNTGVSIKLNLKNIPLEVTEEVIKRTVEKSSTYAKELVREDLGNLKSSITPHAEGMNGEVYSESDYSLAQEYGMPSGKNNMVRKSVPAGGGNGYTYSPYMRPSAEKAGSQKEIDKATVASMARYNK